MESKKRKILSINETKKSIDIWKNYVEDLRMFRKNSHVLKEIKEVLQREYNIFLSPEEIRTRINNLTKKFRTVRKKIGPSGGTPSQWELYPELNEFLGKFKSNRAHEIAEETINADAMLEGSLSRGMDNSFIQTLSPSSALARPMSASATSNSADGLSSSSGSTPISVPEPSRMPSQSPSPSPTQRPKKFSKDYATQKLLELAEEEAVIFKNFCLKTMENDDKRTKYLEENLKIQQEILKHIQNK